MRTRPVFESYSEFVSSLYTSINEKAEGGVDFDTFVSTLNNFLDPAAQSAFKGFRNIASLSPEVIRTGSKSIDPIQEVLGREMKAIQGRISNNDRISTKLTEKTITEVKTFKYNNVINGKVAIPVALGNDDMWYQSNAFTDRKDFNEDYNTKGAYMDIYDLFTLINANNLDNFSPGGPGTEEKAVKTGFFKKGTGWNNALKDKKATDIYNTGIKGQYILTSTASGLSFKPTSSGSGQLSPIADFKTDKLNAGNVKDEIAYNTLLLYGIEDYLPTDPSNTNMIPSSYIDKILVPVKGTSKEYTQPIDGGSAMFEQGSSTLNSKNKTKINQMLTAALSPLAGLPESITIVGGASYEGGIDINKELVVKRAEAVKARFIELYPALKDLITVKKGIVKDYDQIQPTDDPSKYEDFRKVYVIVKGVVQGDTTYTEKPILVDTEIPAGSMTIKLYVISFEYTDETIAKGERKR